MPQMHNSPWLEMPAKQTPLLKNVYALLPFFTDLLTSKQFHNSLEFSVFKNTTICPIDFLKILKVTDCLH